MNNVVKSFISKVLVEVNITFEIPNHLKGFSLFDPESSKKFAQARWL